MGSSKKHHYIPQFYLKGFTNEQGKYYLFDKKTEEVRSTNPQNSFFENNRNSAFVNEEKLTFLEDLYAHFDSITAPLLEKIRKSSLESFELEPEILHRIKMFIAQIYWRVPENDTKFEETIDSLSFKEAGFDFKNKVTGESIATNEFQNDLKKVEVFRQMYRIIIPLISTQKKYQSTDYENWRVYFRKDRLHLTGDNPLIIDKFEDYSSLTKELLFPLSADRLFIHTVRPKPKTLPPKFLLELDMLILQQASRFVCCPSRPYLEFLVNNLYSYSKNHDFADKMKSSIFSYFK